MRDLTRARQAAVEDLRRKRQHISSLLLRLGLHYAGKTTWTKTYMKWLMSQKLAHAEQRIAFEEMLLAVRQAEERIARLEAAIRAAVPDWSLCEVVDALMAMRGIDMISATGFLAEIGDLSRFRTARADGLSRPGALGAFDRGSGEARRDHQGRKRAGAAHCGRVLVGLSASASGGKEQAGQGCGGAAAGSRDRLEGATPALRALSGADRQGQAQGRGCDCDGARAVRLHLGDQSRNHHRRCGGIAAGHSMKR
jgi:hypothetical protein